MSGRATNILPVEDISLACFLSHLLYFYYVFFSVKCDVSFLVFICLFELFEMFCEPGLSRATAGLGETFSWGSHGEKIFKFFFLKWRIPVYFIFLSENGAPKHHRVRGNLSPLTLPA